MSIPALNNTSDYDVYFKQYLKSLELQNVLNKKNFDANYAFKKTGVQETERADMRPIEERMNDVEKLKVQARMMLNKVTDATNTNEIMDYLLQNDKILFFFIQNFPALEEVVKRQFSGGILASQMISLIYRSYLKYTDEVLIPDSNDYQLVSSLVTQEDIVELINVVNQLDIRDTLQNNINKFISQDEKNKLINNPEKFVKEISDIAKINKDNLTYDDINPLIDAYNDRGLKFNDGSSDKTIADRELILRDKLTYLVDSGNLDTLNITTKKVKIPEKTNTKELILIRKEKKILLSEESKLLRLQKKQEKIKIAATKLAERLKKTKNENTKQKLEEKLRLEKINQETTQQALEQKEKEINEKKQNMLYKQTQLERAYNPQLGKARSAASAAAQAQTAAAAQAQAQPAPQAQPTQTGTGLMDNREKHIHRFKVLKGEVLAGNLSSSVIKELKSLVVKMINFNELEPPQALMILKELNKIK